jgi:hypothetical protein
MLACTCLGLVPLVRYYGDICKCGRRSWRKADNKRLSLSAARCPMPGLVSSGRAARAMGSGSMHHRTAFRKVTLEKFYCNYKDLQVNSMFLFPFVILSFACELSKLIRWMGVQGTPSQASRISFWVLTKRG